ncbi:MAG: hypothetical protein KA314_22225 [Chloroflexi bacterium]|nr:hypothetical protein [Chloroflexota bacterium]MBP8058560.1 hypothetical protein [Chloroflexota bacterium]
MNDTFDFRPYVNAWLKRWWLVMGGALLTGIVAAALSLLFPPIYSANALVLVLDSQQIIQFDPRFQTTAEARPRQAYPDLALSDDLVQQLLVAVTPLLDKPLTREGFRDQLTVMTENDPSLLRLTVEYREAEVAAAIANRWADLFVHQTNQIIGDQSQEQMQFYTTQRDNALRALNQAEQILVTFQAANRVRIVKAELSAQETALQQALSRQQRLITLQQDITTLHTHLSTPTGPLLPAEEVALTLIFVRVFGDATTNPALALPLTGSAPVTTDRTQAVAALNTLAVTLADSADRLAAQIEQLEPNILALQQETQRLQDEEERLRQDVKLATETYTALARQAAEDTISSQDASQGLRLASPAITPDEPIAPQAGLNGLLATVIAFAALTLVVVFRVWQEQGSGEG